MKKILIVNNDFDTMDLLKNWLERKAYQVKYTGNHEEVNNLLKEFSPQLIIVDALQRQVAENIKKEAQSSSVPILMMTGYTLGQNKSRLPGNDVIEKPFNLDLLERKIEKLISV